MTDPGAARSARELGTPQRLREFFAPRSIALVGASDNSGWVNGDQVEALDVLVVTRDASGTEQVR